MIIDEGFVEFTGKQMDSDQERGEQPWYTVTTIMDIHDIEAIQTIVEPDASIQYYVISANGNEYPINEEACMDLSEFWKGYRLLHRAEDDS